MNQAQEQFTKLVKDHGALQVHYLYTDYILKTIVEIECEVCLRDFVYIPGLQRMQKNDAWTEPQMCGGCCRLYYLTYGWTDPNKKKDLSSFRENRNIEDKEKLLMKKLDQSQKKLDEFREKYNLRKKIIVPIHTYDSDSDIGSRYDSDLY
jgi:hypothetical protein